MSIIGMILICFENEIFNQYSVDIFETFWLYMINIVSCLALSQKSQNVILVKMTNRPPRKLSIFVQKRCIWRCFYSHMTYTLYTFITYSAHIITMRGKDVCRYYYTFVLFALHYGMFSETFIRWQLLITLSFNYLPSSRGRSVTAVLNRPPPKLTRCGFSDLTFNPRDNSSTSNLSCNRIIVWLLCVITSTVVVSVLWYRAQRQTSKTHSIAHSH